MTSQKYNRAAGLAVVCPLTSVSSPIPLPCGFISKSAMAQKHGLADSPSLSSMTGRQTVFWSKPKICSASCSSRPVPGAFLRPLATDSRLSFDRVYRFQRRGSPCWLKRAARRSAGRAESHRMRVAAYNSSKILRKGTLSPGSFRLRSFPGRRRIEGPALRAKPACGVRRVRHRIKRPISMALFIESIS